MLGDVLKWSPSPHIYRGEPPSPWLGIVHEPPWIDFIIQWWAATSKTWGGGAHGQVGRPSRSAGLPVGPPTFSFFGWVASGVYLLMVLVWALVMLNFFSGGLLIHVWWCLIGRCLLLCQKGYDCPPFSVKTCTHRNLEGHVEFGDLLVAWV